MKQNLRHIKMLQSYFDLRFPADPDREPRLELLIGHAGVDKPSSNGGYDYYLDFGTHLGEGMEKICGLEHFKDDIEIHGFEANPHVFQKIEFQDDVNYYNIAVTDANGFFEVNYELNNGGATMINLANWNPEKVYQWKKDERYQKYGQAITPSMSIANILEWLLPNKKEKSILAKFDIEGAEYGVFEELRKTDNFKWFSKIYVEFHWSLFEGVKPKTSDMEWLSYFESIGLTTVLWD